MKPLLIVGASARAAAASAVRAGFEPWCADLFVDADLRAMVPDSVRCPIEQYPVGLERILRSGPPGPWIYTGGLENHPKLIRKMAATRPLWGNGPAALRACRNPFNIEHLLRQASLPALRVLATGAAVPAGGRWLRKPLRGSAGQGIAFADAGTTVLSKSEYLQEFVEGSPMSAVFVRARGATTLLGVTEQLIGVEWLHAPPFRYCGNVGPVDVSESLRHELLLTGQTLGDRCGLLGFYGIDFVLHDGRPWVVEVNPRYPASVEVLELGLGLASLVDHRMAFDPSAAATPSAHPDRRTVAKAIVYAPRRVEMPRQSIVELIDAFGRLGAPVATTVSCADVPHPGDVIAANWPILTLLAEGPDCGLCVSVLEQAAHRLVDTIVPRTDGSE